MNKKMAAAGLAAGLVAGTGAGFLLSITGSAGAAGSTTAALTAAADDDTTADTASTGIDAPLGDLLGVLPVIGLSDQKDKLLAERLAFALDPGLHDVIAQKLVAPVHFIDLHSRGRSYKEIPKVYSKADPDDRIQD